MTDVGFWSPWIYVLPGIGATSQNDLRQWLRVSLESKIRTVPQLLLNSGRQAIHLLGPASGRRIVSMHWGSQESVHFERIQVNAETRNLSHIIDHERSQQEQQCARRHHRVQVCYHAVVPDDGFGHTAQTKPQRLETA